MDDAAAAYIVAAYMNGRLTYYETIMCLTCDLGMSREAALSFLSEYLTTVGN